MTQLNYQRKQAGPRISVRRGQRWIRRTFTRENFTQTLKTLAWVVPLTVLIWVYAESEQIRPRNDVSLPIEIHIENTEKVVSLTHPFPDKTIVANLQGSEGNLNRFLSEVNAGAPLRIEIAANSDTGNQLLNTRDHIRNLPLLTRYGISVDSCVPDQLVVDVEELKHVEVQVQAPSGIETIVGQPVFVPATITLSGPAPLMPQKPVAYADLAGLDILNKPGEHTISHVVIKPPGNSQLSFSPVEVKATINVREYDVPYVYPSIQISGVIPLGMMGHETVEVIGSQIVPNVTILGPPDKIAILKRPDFAAVPRALLDIKPSDDPGRTYSRKPRIELPENMGLHVANEDSIQPIDFKLTDVQTPQ